MSVEDNRQAFDFSAAKVAIINLLARLLGRTDEWFNSAIFHAERHPVMNPFNCCADIFQEFSSAAFTVAPLSVEPTMLCKLQ